MAFDAIARALLTGSVGYLRGQRRREEEARERAAEESEAALAAAKAKREAQTDEMRRRFTESQIRANDALAHSRMNPTPSARNIDPLSPEGITATADRERRLAEIRARYRQPPEASAAQTDQAAREEAEGLAIYNSPQISPEVARLLSRSFQAARKAGSTLSPGRLMLKVYQGLRRSRPDLFRENDGAASTTDRLEAMALGGEAGHVEMQTAPGLRSGNQPSPLVASDEGAEDAPPLTAAEIQQFRGLVALSPNPRQALLDAGLTPEEVAQVLP